MVSMTIEPVMMPTKAGPIGEHRQQRRLQRMAQNNATHRQPFARAVRIKLECSTSIIEPRVIRAMLAI